MRLLLLVVLTTGLAMHSHAQLFPFSNLHSYFKNMSGDGPGADTHDETEITIVPSDPVAVPAPAAVAAAVPSDTFVPPPPPPAANERRPPPNHRLEEDGHPAEAAPIPGLRRAPFPSQVLQPPALAPALDYGEVFAAATGVPPPSAFYPTPVPKEHSGSVPAFFTPSQPALVLVPPPELASPTSPSIKSSQKTIPIPNKSIKTKPGASSSYPKKYRPDNEKSNPQKVDQSVESPPKKKSSQTKKATAGFSKEQLQFKQQQRQKQQVEATKEAASFQRPVAPLAPSEQETAESGFAGVTAGIGLGSSDRVEFQMHGQNGPHTYKWGYDTGKGHNRQFRYEERDVHGHVKGHYGFYDKHGKLQVVSYSADPEHGYQADGNFGKHGIH